MKVNGLLLVMLGATETTSGPELAPEGMVMVMDVPLQELMVTGAPFRVTTLPPWEVPKPDPVITTWLPIEPVVAETAVITGAGVAAVLAATKKTTDNHGKNERRMGALTLFFCLSAEPKRGWESLPSAQIQAIKAKRTQVILEKLLVRGPDSGQ